MPELCVASICVACVVRGWQVPQQFPVLRLFVPLDYPDSPPQPLPATGPHAEYDLAFDLMWYSVCVRSWSVTTRDARLCQVLSLSGSVSEAMFLYQHGQLSLDNIVHDVCGSDDNLCHPDSLSPSLLSLLNCRSDSFLLAWDTFSLAMRSTSEPLTVTLMAKMWDEHCLAAAEASLNLAGIPTWSSMVGSWIDLSAGN